MMESFYTMEHAQKLLRGFEEFRTNLHLTDVAICVENKVFHCHKLVLAGTSPYFDAMFMSGLKECQENKVYIRNLTEQTVESVINFIYSGTVVITWDNVEEIMEAGNLFQMDMLKSRCTKFLTEHSNPTNCLGIWKLARRLDCAPLAELIKPSISKEFYEVVKHEEFLSLETDELADIISDDDLSVENEELVCDATLVWLKQDFKERSKTFSAVMKYLRLPLLSPEYLVDVFQLDVQCCDKQCHELLDEAKRHHMLPARHHEVDTPRTKPRTCYPLKDALLIFATKIAPPSGHISDVKCYYFDTGQWSTLPPFPSPQSFEFAICSFGNDIFVSGGTKTPNDTYQLCTSSLEWRCRAPMKEGRIRHLLVGVGNRLYAVGGYSATSILGTIEEYSISGDKWQTVAQLNQAVCLSACSVVGQKIYIFGGLIDDQTSTALIQCYDTRHQVMSNVGNLPFKCALHRAVPYGKDVYIINRTGKVMKFSSDGKTEIVSQLDNFNRNYFGAVSYRGSLYIFGGRVGNDPQTDIHKYDFMTKTWTLLPMQMPEHLTIAGCGRTLISVIP